MPLRARTYIGSLVRSLAVELDAAGIRGREPDDHVERCRLARAVRTQQSDDFAGAHFEADAADDRSTAA